MFNPPGLFLVKFEGYWEHEPENGGVIYLNPVQVIYTAPFKYDERGAVSHYKIVVNSEEYPFIVFKDQVAFDEEEGINVS